MAQTSLRIRAIISEPLLAPLIFYDSYATDQTSFGFSKIKKATHARLRLHLSKCHIVGNHMSRLIYASSKSSGMTVLMCSLPRAFSAH